MPNTRDTGRPLTNQGTRRRRRLLAEVQGRRLEEAYLSLPGVRADLEAEANSADPDALATPERLAHLREWIEAKRLVLVEGKIPGDDRGTDLMAGRAVLRSLSEGTGGEEGPPALGGPGGAEVFAPRMFRTLDPVVIVPGFMASALGDTVSGGRGLVWGVPTGAPRDDLRALRLGPYDGRERELDPGVRIGALGPLPFFYDLLRLALEVRRYNVEVFAFDWRRDLDLASGMLAARLRDLAGQSWRPIHLVAHSQGALVARRALQLLGRVEARRIVKHLVLLGPANFGSFAAAFALAGGHRRLPMMRTLAIGPRRGLQPALASMSGVYQLLPFDRERAPWLRERDLASADFWKAPIDPARMARFSGWARSIRAEFMDDRTAVILGDDGGGPTPGGLAYRGGTLADSPRHGLAGDGVVPHSCSVLPGARTYLAPDAGHAMLAADRAAIGAVLDLLAGRPVGLAEVSSDFADHLAPVTSRAPAPARTSGRRRVAV